MSSNLANNRLHKNLSVDSDEHKYIAVIQDIHDRNREEQHFNLKDMSIETQTFRSFRKCTRILNIFEKS